MPTCGICNTTELLVPEEIQMQACAACAGKIGLIPMPPAERPPASCMRCNGRKFLRAIPREHSSASAGEINAQISVPMFLTHPPSFHRGWLFHHAEELKLTQGHGLFEVYICHGCGFVEWYCRDVASIPVHPHLMTEVVDYGADGPYR